MKVRGTIGGTPFSAKLTVLCWGALTLLVPVAVSACTSSSSPSTPSVTFSPSVTTGTATVTATSSSAVTTPSDGTPTPGVTPTGTPATPEVTVTQTFKNDLDKALERFAELWAAGLACLYLGRFLTHCAAEPSCP